MRSKIKSSERIYLDYYSVLERALLKPWDITERNPELKDKIDTISDFLYKYKHNAKYCNDKNSLYNLILMQNKKNIYEYDNVSAHQIIKQKMSILEFPQIEKIDEILYILLRAYYYVYSGQSWALENTITGICNEDLFGDIRRTLNEVRIPGLLNAYQLDMPIVFSE